MTYPSAPLANPEIVSRLATDFSAAGYDADHVPQLLGADAHHALGRGHRWPALSVTAGAAADGSTLATLTRLFLLGASEPAARVERALATLGLQAALDDGLVEEASDETGPSAAGPGLLRATVDIRPHADDQRGYLVVSDFDSDDRPGPMRPDHVVGIGSASLLLARATIRRPVKRALDLGTGCGVQSLHLSAHTETIVATDTNPRALTFAAASAQLSGVTWETRQGSLYEPVAGERFDLVVSNPPFVVSAGGDLEYRDSGWAGDEVSRRLISATADHLTPGGTAQFLANWIVRDEGDWRLSVGAWVADTGLDGWVVQRDLASPIDYISMWLSDGNQCDDPHGPEALKAAEQWLDYFRSERATGIGMGYVTLRKPKRTSDRLPDVIFDELLSRDDALVGPEVDAFLARRRYLAELSDDALLDEKLSLAAADLLHQQHVPSDEGWIPVLRQLHRPGVPGATVQLDEWGQALLGGCTGAVTLRTQVEILAGAHGLDPAALVTAVIPTVRTAITRGLLHPVDGPPR